MRNRHGFTLIEILISVTLLLVIMGVSVQFLRGQTNLVAAQTTRMDALQNAGFAASQIERELREAGAGVVDAQPMLVQIAADAITFNANMVSIDTGDVRAVYQMTDADPNAVRVMLASEALPLPNSSRRYPDTTYLAAKGVESGAETISYWLRPDSSTTLPNRYALFRRVNALPPTLVARGIVKDQRDTLPTITYYTADSLNRLHPVQSSWLPLIHVRLHGANDDTGRTAITDSIRAVRLHFLAAAPDRRTGTDALRTVETFVRLMNSGLLKRSSCGNPPYAPSSAVAVSSALNAPVKTVTLTWSASSDDVSGERDIERYAIFRRLDTETAFADPIASIPSALKSSYSFVDTGVLPGQTYFYAVAAQDCTPAMSDVTVTPTGVTVNP